MIVSVVERLRAIWYEGREHACIAFWRLMEVSYCKYGFEILRLTDLQAAKLNIAILRWTRTSKCFCNRQVRSFYVSVKPGFRNYSSANLCK